MAGPINFSNYSTAKATSVYSIVFAREGGGSVIPIQDPENPPAPDFVKNTWDDWGLIPSKKPSIVLPQVKNNFVEVPGMNGAIDATSVYTSSNQPVYGLREDSWEFMVEHYPKVNNVAMTFEQLKHTIANYLHGQRKIVALTSDPFVYYTGRFQIDDMHTDESWSVITIKYTLDPWGYRTDQMSQTSPYTYAKTL